MTLVIPGERPAAAAPVLAPLRALGRWLARGRARRAQRLALSSLLDLDAHRLADLGLNRGDLFDALRAEQEAARVLSERRARRTRF
jgi:uncharacterized protein YjiS (DUF1127 family)